MKKPHAKLRAFTSVKALSVKKSLKAHITTEENILSNQNTSMTEKYQSESKAQRKINLYNKMAVCFYFLYQTKHSLVIFLDTGS